MSVVLLDTGPLVAYLDRDEAHHVWAVEQFASLSEPVVTCEAVLTEACFLLARSPAAIGKIAGYLRDGIIRCDFQLAMHHEHVFALIARYRNVPMALADACLVCLAENYPGSRIFTLDSDFSVYRLDRRKAIVRIAPR